MIAPIVYFIDQFPFVYNTKAAPELRDLIVSLKLKEKTISFIQRTKSLNRIHFKSNTTVS